MGLDQLGPVVAFSLNRRLRGPISLLVAVSEQIHLPRAWAIFQDVFDKNELQQAGRRQRLFFA